jgi:hypothetical protein
MYYTNPGMVILARDQKVFFLLCCYDERKYFWIYGPEWELSKNSNGECVAFNGLDGEPIFVQKQIRTEINSFEQNTQPIHSSKIPNGVVVFAHG